MGTIDAGSSDNVVARVMAGVCGLLLILTLGLTWATHVDDSGTDTYSGLAILTSGLGGSSADDACGGSCSGTRELVLLSLPAVVLVAAAVALLLLLRGGSRWSRASAVGLCVLTVLGQWLLLITLSRSAGGDDRTTASAGMLLVVVIAVAGIASANAYRPPGRG